MTRIIVFPPETTLIALLPSTGVCLADTWVFSQEIERCQIRFLPRFYGFPLAFISKVEVPSEPQILSLQVGESAPRSSTPLEGKRSRINPLSEIPSNHGPFQSALSLGVLNSPSKSMFPETSSPGASPISSPTPQFWSTSPSKHTGSNHSRYKTEICRSYRVSHPTLKILRKV